MIKGILSIFASILGIVASTGANAASVFIFYEPDVPNCLKK
ncbi:MAG: Cyclic lactone autoinducer peptide [Sporanaerobacter sp.]|jgi:cyclic lactone autoinducer peptide